MFTILIIPPGNGRIYLNNKQKLARNKHYYYKVTMSIHKTNELKPKLIYINYLQCQNGFRTKERSLDNPYFLYVHKGKGRFIIRNTEYTCESGDLFFCPCGTPNTIVADETDPYVLTGVDFEFVEGKPQIQYSERFKEHTNIHNNRQFLWHTFEMIGRYSSGDARYVEYTNVLLHAWLLLVSNLGNYDSDNSAADEIAAFLRANDFRPVTLSELGTQFKYHPNHINRVFKRRYGSTLLQYHMDLRLRKAKELLRFSHENIGEIALKCGFEDLNYFSRVFRQNEGITPSRFRNK